MHTYSRKMKTKTACNKNLDVFDFIPEPEVSEFAIRTKGKLENPKIALDKYTFLEAAASGKNMLAEEINYVPSLDIDAINMNHMAITLVENRSAGTMADQNDACTVVKERGQSSPELKVHLLVSEVNVAATSASPSNDKLKSAILVDSLPSLHELDEGIGMNTDEIGSMCDRSSSSSGVAEDDEWQTAGPSSDHCMDGWEMDGEDITAVTLYPDHVLYRGNCYVDSQISFTSGYVVIEGSEVDRGDETFKCKWGIEDILHITSHWYERIEMAMVKIHVLTKNKKHVEDVECASGTELKFAIIDSSWYEKLETIASLNITYKALWTSMLESEDTAVGHPRISFSKYLPNFDGPFEEVMYPKGGDADAVFISKRDFDLLQPDTYVNDTIIDFYINYLKNKMKPDERHRLHFFNSFFFRKLADPDKYPLDASKGAVAYQRVKKWTRKVNLFEKDYVFIPVNYNYHWSLIVMCHLGEVATYEDEDVVESMKVPCILHMDSIRGSHTGLQGLVQSYLKEEWKARQHIASEDIASRFIDLRFIYLELPQQQNSFDCGLFLLHYVELFLEQAPLHFNPFKISKNSNFLNVDWFPPAEASLKRVVIQKLICDLLEDPHQEPYSTTDNDHQCHLNGPTANAHKGTIVNSPRNSLMHLQISHEHQEIEIPSSPILCANDSNITLKPSFESEFNCATTFGEFENPLAPIELEDVQQDDGKRCSFRDGRTQESSLAPATSDHETENNNHDTSSEISIYGCDDSIEIVKISQPDSEIGQPKSSMPPLDTLNGYVDQMVDGHEDNDNDDDPTTRMGIIMPGSCFRFHDMQVPGSENSSGLDSVVQHPTKRMRMTPPQKVSLL